MAYEKQTWNTTSFVNPTRMNHIENGIESVEAEALAVKVVNLNNSYATKITFTGTAFFTLVILGNSEARVGMYIGRGASTSIGGAWVVPAGANINAAISENTITLTTTSSVQMRVNVLIENTYKDRVIVEQV